MKTKEEIVEYLAKQQFNRYMGGSNDYHVDCSLANYIYQTLLNDLVTQKFNKLVENQIKKHTK